MELILSYLCSASETSRWQPLRLPKATWGALKRRYKVLWGCFNGSARKQGQVHLRRRWARWAREVADHARSFRTARKATKSTLQTLKRKHKQLRQEAGIVASAEGQLQTVRCIKAVTSSHSKRRPRACSPSDVSTTLEYDEQSRLHGRILKASTTILAPCPVRLGNDQVSVHPVARLPGLETLLAFRIQD